MVKQVKILRGHKDSINVIETFENNLLATGSDDGTCRIWDIRTSRSIKCIYKVFNNEPVNALTFSSLKNNKLKDTLSTNNVSLHVGAGKNIYSFDLRKDDILINKADYIYNENQDEINQLSIHSKQNYLSSCDDSGQIKIVDLNLKKVIKTLCDKHTNIITNAIFHPKNPWEIISCGLDSNIFCWDFSYNKKIKYNFNMMQENMNIINIQEKDKNINPPFVYSISYHPSGKTLVAGMGDMSIAIFNLKDKNIICRYIGHNALVSQVKFYNENIFISSGNDCFIKFWNYSNVLLMSPLKENDNPMINMKEEDMIQNKIQHNNKPNWFSMTNNHIYVVDKSCHITSYNFGV